VIFSGYQLDDHPYPALEPWDAGKLFRRRVATWNGVLIAYEVLEWFKGQQDAGRARRPRRKVLDRLCPRLGGSSGPALGARRGGTAGTGRIDE